MCTNIATMVRLAGSAKTREGWFAFDEAAVSFDHASQVCVEHALRVDLFESASSGGRGHVAFELDYPSAKRLVSELTAVIAAADRSGVGE